MVSTIARRTISISSDLDERMKAEGEDVNWSGVCSDACEHKLAEIVERKQVKDMSDVVQRLKSSKLKGDSEVYKCAYESGKSWAMDVAEHAQLRRLQNGYDGLCVDGSSAYDLSECFYAIIEGLRLNASDFSRSDARDFWSDEPDDASDECVFGFADGALYVWEQVQGEI